MFPDAPRMVKMLMHTIQYQEHLEHRRGYIDWCNPLVNEGAPSPTFITVRRSKYNAPRSAGPLLDGTMEWLTLNHDLAAETSSSGHIAPPIDFR